MPFRSHALAALPAALVAALIVLLPQADARASHVELAGRLDGVSIDADIADWEGALTIVDVPSDVSPAALFAAGTANPAAPNFAAFDAATPPFVAISAAAQHDSAVAEPGSLGVLAAGALALALSGRRKRAPGPFDSDATR